MPYPTVPADKERVKQMNPVVLAFVGDAVYTLYVRERLALACGFGTGELNRRTAEAVSAHGQSDALERVLPLLTEEELAVFKRGRNAHVHGCPAGCTVAQYHAATALEALFGWLWLSGQADRCGELFGYILEEEHAS